MVCRSLYWRLHGPEYCSISRGRGMQCTRVGGRGCSMWWPSRWQNLLYPSARDTYTLITNKCMWILFYSAGYHGYCSVEETNSVSFPDIISAILWWDVFLAKLVYTYQYCSITCAGESQTCYTRPGCMGEIVSNASTAFDCCLQSGPEASFHDKETCYLLQCLGMARCGSVLL